MTGNLEQSTADREAAAHPLAESSAVAHWAFINQWKVEPQSDDRSPMFGEVAAGSASPSAVRSTARRKHQAMFKEWSQNRHD